MDSSAPRLIENQILTYDELSVRLRIPRRTLERYVAKGKIPHSRIGRTVRFYWPAIVEWLSKEQMQQQGAKRR